MSIETGTLGRSPVMRIAADVADSRGDELVTIARQADDSVPIVRTGPTGIGGIEPLALCTVEGETAFVSTPSDGAVRDLVSGLGDGDIPEERSDAVVSHPPATATLPIPDTGPLSVGTRRILGPCGWIAPTTPAEYDLVSTEARRDVSAIETVGPLGRGRGDASADEPVFDAWETARAADGDPIVVVNANDTDERQRTDRTLLSGAPIAVLDGAAVVARYLGSSEIIVYLNETATELYEHVARSVEAAELDVDIHTVVGPDEFRAGAPTAALEALEGANRIESRIQPPSPASYGLYGRPTAIHTPRTFAHVHTVLRTPAEAQRSDSRLFTLSGDVAAPATIELGSDDSLAACLDAVELDGSFKMACVGGVFGGVTRTLDIDPTARSLETAGLGTEGAIELFNEGRCPVSIAGERAKFGSEENSGRCVPGREGTVQLTKLLRAIYDGSYDGEKIRELARVMRRSSNCAIGRNTPRPVVSAIDAFDPEFRAHADGRCSSGACTERL